MAPAPLVCLVDDDPDYRALIQQLFSHHLPAYGLTVFSSGERLLEALSALSQLPDLIVLDEPMPGLTGYQTLRRLKAHPLYKRIPVVIMRAEASVDEVRQAYEASANSFLAKPPALNSLIDRFTVVCQYWLTLNHAPLTGE